MSRAKKDSKILNINLDREISDQLELFCEESGQSKTTAVERFLKKGLKDYFMRPKDERII